MIDPRGEQARGPQFPSILVGDHVVRVVRSRPVVMKGAQKVPRNPCRGAHPHEPATPRASRQDLVERFRVEVLFVFQSAVPGNGGRG